MYSGLDERTQVKEELHNEYRFSSLLPWIHGAAYVSFFLKTVREGTDLSGLQFRLKEGVLLPPPIPMH